LPKPLSPITSTEFAIQAWGGSANAAMTCGALIQKIYEVDPLLCPKCGGAMRVIAFIEEKAGF
jgi:hypothetical protein